MSEQRAETETGFIHPVRAGKIIEVNGQSVSFERSQVTGEEIKEHAINEGVPIGREFALAVKRTSGWAWVGDAEHVEIPECERFCAVDAEHARDGCEPCGCHKPHVDIDIKVNHQRVVMRRHVASGLEIKKAAISQGVKILEDFVLSVRAKDGKWEVVADDQRLRLHECEQFMAVAPEEHA